MDDRQSDAVEEQLRVPVVLTPQYAASFRDKFREQFEPNSLAEHVVVNEMARRASRLEFLDQVVESVQRETIRGLLDIDPNAASGSSFDELISRSVSSGRLQECHRQSLGNARGFVRALNTLEQLRKDRETDSIDQMPDIDPQFEDEVDCESHLVARFHSGVSRCRKCSGRRGHWLSRRKCWECADCRSQTGIRVGTVMHCSPLPLVTWFAAIRLQLLASSMRTSEFGDRLSLDREATVRSLQNRIRAANESDDAMTLLAGLDQIYFRYPESNARKSTKM